MRAEYRFLRTREGITRFAKVAIVSEASPEWVIVYSDAVRESLATYGEAIERGLALAIEERNRRFGGRYRIVVEELIETVVDTSVDAVECAVAVAAWKSFGFDDSDVSICFEAGRWSASIDSNENE